MHARLARWIVPVACAALAAVCLPLAALPDDVERGFRPLFDGKSLDGWIGATDGYEAVDGTLQCKPGAGGNLFTAKEYRDFELRFEFQLTPGANNGLGIRAPKEGDAAFAGMELQILDEDHEKYKGLKPWQVHGSIYGVVGAKRGHLKPVGEWNTQRVIVRGRQVTVFLNGEKIVDANLDEAKPVDGKEHPGLYRDQGHIGFLGHGSKVAFRNIRIQEFEAKKE